jgi:hypothetical protein
MFAFARNALFKSNFRSALEAAKKNPLNVQKEIASYVFSHLRDPLKNGATEAEWRGIGLAAAQNRQGLTAQGNRSESNPEYARFALLESAVFVLFMDDERLKKTVHSELFQWFESLGVGRG